MIKVNFWKITLAALLLCSGPARALHVETPSDILNASQVEGGLIVQIGCGDGRSAVALGANDRYVVHSLDADAAKVAEARRTVRAAGLSQSVWVDRLDGRRLPFAENMVNLLIAENLGAVPMNEVMRVLVPNGIACIKQDGKWVRKSKPRPADIDE